MNQLWMVMAELSPWLLLGALISGLLHGLLPAGFVRRHLQGRSGVLKAVLIGIPLPLCSCGVIPAGVGLKRDGASDGAAVGFLTATPQTGGDSILVSAGMLGLPFALLKVLAALVTGVLSGWLVDATAPTAVGEDGQSMAAAVPDAVAAPPAHDSHAARGMALHAIDMIRMIWRWLVFGVVVSAALGAWLPPGALATLGVGTGITAYLLVLLASVPLYVCATASVPIAAALVAGGLPTGAALVFLMAGPATNVATVGAVWRAFNGRVVIIYLTTLILGSIGFGLAFEAASVSIGFNALGAVDPHAGHHAITWWQHVSVVVLIGLLVWFAGEDLRALIERGRGFMQKHKITPTIIVGVQGMTCGGCSSRLERVLQRGEGVASAKVLLEEARAEVQGDISLERIVKMIEDAGFEAIT